MRLPSVLTPDIEDTIHQAGDFGDNYDYHHFGDNYDCHHYDIMIHQAGDFGDNYDDIDGEAGSGSKEDNVTLNSLML